MSASLHPPPHLQRGPASGTVASLSPRAHSSCTSLFASHSGSEKLQSPPGDTPFLTPGWPCPLSLRRTVFLTHSLLLYKGPYSTRMLPPASWTVPFQSSPCQDDLACRQPMNSCSPGHLVEEKSRCAAGVQASWGEPQPAQALVHFPSRTLRVSAVQDNCLNKGTRL